MEIGSIVAALAAMGMLMVGIFQFLRGYIQSTNKDYAALLDKYEKQSQKLLEVETSKLHWENRARVALASNRRLRKDLQKCHETLNSYLIKTQPIRDEILKRLEDEDTYIPPISEQDTEVNR